MRRGNQKPTFSVIGEYSHSAGREVAEVFEAEGGASFYPCQMDELELMLARNADGSPAASILGISKARQNGKSYSARYYAAYMGDFEHRAVLYSAHHGNTSRKMFNAMLDLFDNPERFPEFAHDVKRISRARGYEGIYFKDWVDANGDYQEGGCIEFATRTNSGSRGGTYSVIIVDEAQELTKEQQEGMLPVISAASDVSDVEDMPQQIYIGTPPGPSCTGTVFAKMHDTAHSDEPGGTWWLEWSIDGTLDKVGITEHSVLDLAYKTNPAMGYRIAEKTVLDEFATMDMDGFARERLGWWSPAVVREVNYVIPEKAWDACASIRPKPEGKTAYGVKFSADASEVCLCGAVIPVEGPARVSMIERQPTGIGIQWLADWLNARYDRASCVVIDGRNGVDVLIEKIAPTWRMKGSVVRPGVKDMIAAVGTLTDAVNEKSVTWYKEQTDLRDSAVTSIKRKIGGGYGFGGENSIPIEAAALALYGAKTAKRDPSKVMRIG